LVSNYLNLPQKRSFWIIVLGRKKDVHLFIFLSINILLYSTGVVNIKVGNCYGEMEVEERRSGKAIVVIPIYLF
jgi:hypothetical protein